MHGETKYVLQKYAKRFKTSFQRAKGGFDIDYQHFILYLLL